MDSENIVEVSAGKLQSLLNADTETIRATKTRDVPVSTPIAEVATGNTYTLVGVVRSVDSVNTFTRNDGSEGQVRNVTLQDSTGSIRLSLWGEYADRTPDVGMYAHVFDAEVSRGYQDALEASVGRGSSIRFISDDSDETKHVTITLDK